ncbi:MAG: TerC family protein [Candidatus Dasytiphilus stammeri]
MFDWLIVPSTWISLATLLIIEIILGIDNIVFLSLIVSKLPASQQNLARCLGLSGAMIIRLVLLTFIAWLIRLTQPLLILKNHVFSVRDIIMLLSGIFLIWKSIIEIHYSIYPYNKKNWNKYQTSVHSFTGSIIKIILLDIIFSLDSVITAVGLSDHLFIMFTAVMIAFIVMMFLAKKLGELISNHPPVKILALSFLFLVGFTLIIESFSIHIHKEYLYFSIIFSIIVEILNFLYLKNSLKNK